MRYTSRVLILIRAMLVVTAPAADAQDKLVDIVRRHSEPFETVHIVEYSPAELSDLIRGSRLSVQVVVNGSSSRLTRDERSIETEYSLGVLGVLRGPDALVGTRIGVTRYGGTLVIAGRTIRAIESGFPEFLDGEEYILFLAPSLIDGRYRVNYGGQGAFRINGEIAEQISKPDDRSDITVEQLANEVRALSK